MTPVSQDFMVSYQQADEFPSNGIPADTFPHTRKSYADRLNEEKDRIFCSETDAQVHILELHEQGQKYELSTVTNTNDMHRKLLPYGYSNARADPQSRIFFIHAASSRAKLRITKDMFVHVLTFLQAMPTFLDFVFPFGHQIEARDTHFSGFRSLVNMDPKAPGVTFSEFARSGCGYHMCFNLKSVEPNRGGSWSIRPAAIYHSFDITSGASSFITIKGSKLMQNRITPLLTQTDPSNLDKLASSFATSLTVNSVFVEWSAEHWRWYINFLNDSLQSTTLSILNTRIDSESEVQSQIKRITHAATRHSLLTEPETQESTRNAPTRNFRYFFGSRGMDKQEADIELGDVNANNQSDLTSSKNPFEFSDIQKMANVEQDVAEAKRVLNCNIDTLEALKEHYSHIWKDGNFPLRLKRDCQCHFVKFESQLKSVIDDLKRHRLNLEDMLGVLEVRKNVLNNMFTYRNIQESRVHAQKAQISSQNMEEIGQITLTIARKTELETIAMRVVTLITLCFLPATFICTLMSTDIVQWSSDNDTIPPKKTFALGALELFLELCLPLMAITLALSYIYYRHVRGVTNAKYNKLARRFAAQRMPTAGTYNEE